MNSANRIILNTAVMYASLVIKMVIGLFCVRWILQALGESDYGVYALVAGAVSMLEVLNASMSNTSMRYLAHSLGSNNNELIIKTFKATLSLHYYVGFATVLLMEFCGVFLFLYVFNIPQDSLSSAHIIFHLMVISSFISIIAVPYDAVINAHEHIWVLSLFELLGAFCQLFMALFLLVAPGNRLVLYGSMMLAIQVIIRIGKLVYSKRNFYECRRQPKVVVEKDKQKEILFFTGWSLLSSIAAISVTQIRSIIINTFFGVRLNAASGIADQSSGFINQFAVSMTRAINPQIMKSEGGGDREKMIYVVKIGAKYSSFLFALIGIPVIIEAPFLLKLWLHNVPEYAVIFCQLSVAQMLVEKFTFQITHAIKAVGQIKQYQIAESLCCFLYIPFSFFAFKMGMPPFFIYLFSIAGSVVLAVVRLYYGRKIAGINSIGYVKEAIAPLFLPLCLSTSFALVVVICFSPSLIRAFFVFALFIIVFSIFFWFFSIPIDEKDRWKNIFDTMFNNLFRR